SHPGDPRLVTPFRRGRAAGGSEKALAIVLAEPGNRRRLEFLEPGTDEVEVEATPVLQRVVVVEGEIDAGRLLVRNIQVGRGDKARQPDRAELIAVDQVAESPREHALGDDQR